VNGSLWINEGAKLRGTKYPEKYKEVHGEESNPEIAPFDPEVAVLAGQGQRNGRLWIADGSVDPKTVPSMRQIRRGRTSDQPAVETRPRPSVAALEQLREEMATDRARREAAEQRQQLLEQQLSQQQGMLEQQQQMMRWMTTQMFNTAPPGTFANPPFDLSWMGNQGQPGGSAGGSNSQAPPSFNVNNPSIIRRLDQSPPGGL